MRLVQRSAICRRLRSVRYVITLDSDTRLPRDAGRELVGCAAHPLNQAELDPHSRVVVAGYAVLQPRLTATMPAAHRSRFSRLAAGDAGIDPYTLQTSDLYHDLFGQGSFIGKGIYDVEAFESACAGRFPENRLLSHDLIEGCFARSGLVNDVELFEGVPSRLLVDMNRRCRWIRGDWQIASWLGSRVPTLRGNGANPLSGLSRWKILDNLRRSLTPALLWSFLLLGWLLAPALAGACTLLALAIAFGPATFAALPGMLRRPEGKPRTLHAADEASQCLRTWLVETVGLCILPYTAHCHLDAIVRTLYRLGISRSRLLEWTTASEAEASCSRKLRDHYAIMWACAASSFIAAALLLAVQPGALLGAGPVLLAWMAGPLIAWWLSLPYRDTSIPATDAEQRQLRRWARRTWHYFDAFAGEADHWLPPDHVQGDPPTTVASRTSPTNMGLALLSGLAACDLGYLPAAAFLERTSRMLQSMRRLERCRGHFYNWYNTRTLKPTEPRYVSSVDSGNLWGSLTVLSAGLEELRNRPLIPPRLLEGLQDTVEVIADLHRQAASSAWNDPLDACIAALREECSGAVRGSAANLPRLRRIRQRAADLAMRVSADQPVLQQWTLALARQSAQAHQHLSRLAFWTQFVRPRNGFPAESLQAPSSAASQLARQSNREDPSARSPCFPSSAGSAVAVQERLCEPLGAAADQEKRADLEKLYAWFERLDVSCSLGQAPRCGTDRRRPRLAVGSGRGRGFRQGGPSARIPDVASERAGGGPRSRLGSPPGIAAHRFTYQALPAILGDGFSLSFPPAAEAAGRGFQRERSPLRRKLLRLAGLGSPPDQLSRRKSWPASPRALVCPRPDGYAGERRAALLSWSGSMFEYLLPM